MCWVGFGEPPGIGIEEVRPDRARLRPRPGQKKGRAVGPLDAEIAADRLRRKQSAEGEQIDLTPSLHWPEPRMIVELQPEGGPVLVEVEYFIELERAHEFTKAMDDVRRERLRDGAMRWGLFSDSANRNRFVETFLLESWVEHMRQHERVTKSDRMAEELALAFHIGAGTPKIGVAPPCAAALPSCRSRPSSVSIRSAMWEATAPLQR